MQLDRPPGLGRIRYDADCDCTVCRCDSCLQWWPLDTDFWRAQPAYKSKRYPSRKCRACEAERRLAA